MSGSTADVRIVVLIGSGLNSSQLSSVAGEPSILERMLDAADDHITVSVVSLGLTHPIAGVATHIRLFDSDYGLLDRLFRRLGFFEFRVRLAAYPLGRLLNSLAPFDQGRVFWRTVRRDSRSRTLIMNSDIAIASDIQSTRTAWFSERKHWVGRALYDHRATSIWNLNETTESAS